MSEHDCDREPETNDASPSPAPPPLPPRPREASDLTRRCFVALFALCLVYLVWKANAPLLTDEPDADATAEADLRASTAANLEWRMRARLLLTFGAENAPPLLKKNLRDLTTPDTPEGWKNHFVLRRALVLSGHLGRRDDARRLADALDDAPQTDLQRRINAVLRRLYLADPPGAPSEDEMETIRAGLGWHARLVEADRLALENPDAAREARGELRDDARGHVLALGFFMAGGLLVFLAGLLLIVVFAVAHLQGHVAWRGRQAFAPPESGAPAMPPWIAFEAFTLYLALFAFAHFAAERLPDGSPLTTLVGFANLLLAPLCVLWPLARRVHPSALARFIGWRRGRGWLVEIAAGAAGYAAMIPCVVAAATLSTVLASLGDRQFSQTMHPLVPFFTGEPSASEIASLLLLAVVIAPLTEEVFFRGLFHASLRARASVVLAVVLGGLLFAAIHPQGPLGVPMLFVIGAGLAVVREWRGALIAPIVAHALVNGVSATIFLTAL